MKKQTLGVIAGAAGAALLLSGGTFALWSDSADVNGGEITAGNLDVAVVDTAWTDTSSDRSDAGHTIDLNTFTIVPGDTITGKFGVDVGLEGETLLAQPKRATADGELTGHLAAGLNLKYSVQNAAGTEVATGDAAGVTVDLVSTDNGNKGSAVVAGTKTTDGTADFNVVVTATFDAATSDQDLAKAQAELAGAGIELNQVRAGQGYN
ncbi:MAG: alternate-type signal peptide domain-containing protein [Brevibacterium sp.]|nr:alternate-type signal peptide domain-containing protein [Brevibacterium sp.]